MGKRSKMPGLVEAAVIASAIAHATKGQYLKNGLTDTVRVAMFNPVHKTAFGGEQDMYAPAAVLTLLGYEYGRTELNKMGKNPKVGPTRLF